MRRVPWISTLPATSSHIMEQLNRVTQANSEVSKRWRLANAGVKFPLWPLPPTKWHTLLEVEKKGIACQLWCILIQTTESANVSGSIYSGLFTVWPLSGLSGETLCKHTCLAFIFQQLYSSIEKHLPQSQPTSLPLCAPHSVISAEIVTPRCFVELTKEWVPEWTG